VNRPITVSAVAKAIRAPHAVGWRFATRDGSKFYSTRPRTDFTAQWSPWRPVTEVAITRLIETLEKVGLAPLPRSHVWHVVTMVAEENQLESADLNSRTEGVSS